MAQKNLGLFSTCALGLLTACVPDNYSSTYHRTYEMVSTPAPVVVEHRSFYGNYQADRLARETRHLRYETARLHREQARHAHQEARVNAEVAHLNRQAEIDRYRVERAHQRDLVRQQRAQLAAQRHQAQVQARLAAQQQHQAQLQQMRLQAERDRQAAFEQAAQKSLNDERRRLAEINARQARHNAMKNAQAAGNTPLSSNAFKSELASAVRQRNLRQGHSHS